MGDCERLEDTDLDSFPRRARIGILRLCLLPLTMQAFSLALLFQLGLRDSNAAECRRVFGGCLLIISMFFLTSLPCTIGRRQLVFRSWLYFGPYLSSKSGFQRARREKKKRGGRRRSGHCLQEWVVSTAHGDRMQARHKNMGHQLRALIEKLKAERHGMGSERLRGHWPGRRRSLTAKSQKWGKICTGLARATARCAMSGPAAGVQQVGKGKLWWAMEKDFLSSCSRSIRSIKMNCS